MGDKQTTKSGIIDTTIAHGLSLFHPEGEPFEVRLFPNGTSLGGIFTDCLKAGQAILPYIGKCDIYHSVQPIADLQALDMAQRGLNRLGPGGGGVTNAAVDTIRFLFIDLDPIRPTKTSATDEQLAAALKRRDMVQDYLAEHGWEPAIVMMSGNGGHLYYLTDLPVTDGQNPLGRGLLEALAARFSDDKVDIDLSVHNPGRISKVPGTWATKGEDTVETPHRMAYIEAFDLDIEPLRADQIMSVIDALSPGSEDPALPTRQSGYIIKQLQPYRHWTADEFRAALSRLGIRWTEKTTSNGRLGFVLEGDCLTGVMHDRDRGAMLSLDEATGRPGYTCHHAKCQGLGWADVRETLFPDYYSQPYHQNGTAPSPAAPEPEDRWPDYDRVLKAVTDLKDKVDTEDPAFTPDIVADTAIDIADRSGALSSREWEKIYRRLKRLGADATGLQRQRKESRTRYLQDRDKGRGLSNDKLYTVEDGLMCYITPKGVLAPVASFTCKITAEVRKEGDEDIEPVYTLEGDGLRTGRFTVDIPAGDFQDHNALKRVIMPKAGRDYIYPRMAYHLPTAIQYLSEDREITWAFERTGWAMVDGERVFVAPGLDRDGIRVDLPDTDHYDLSSGDLEKGLEGLAALLRVWTPETAVVALVPFFQAALNRSLMTAIGHTYARYNFFIVGQSGSLKTSFAKAAMSLFGPAYIQNHTLTSLDKNPSATALVGFATKAADMPKLYDNFKPNTTKLDIYSLLTAFVEGRDKERLNQQGKTTETAVINHMPIFTGEDLPSDDTSVIARSMAVFVDNGMVAGSLPHLDTANEAARLGNMQAVGRAWVQWVEDTWANPTEAQIETARAAWQSYTEGWSTYIDSLGDKPTNRQRIIANLATATLVFAQLCEHPDLGPVFEPLSVEFHRGVKDVAQRLVNLARETREEITFLDQLATMVARGGAYLLPKGINEQALYDAVLDSLYTPTEGGFDNGPSDGLKAEARRKVEAIQQGLVGAYDRFGIYISTARVTDLLNRVPSATRAGRLSEANLKDRLKTMGACAEFYLKKEAENTNTYRVRLTAWENPVAVVVLKPETIYIRPAVPALAPEWQT